MYNPDYYSKIIELKKQLEEESLKEEPDMNLVQKLREKILYLGMSLTTPDIIKNRYG